ncbi:cytochrome c oxidase assembly protein [Modicisalibacter luteus]|uniref:cytochrome c oxidase assembly protein n=1 Tax=Modicisalibacter luteus TaxID=453962 RepID=UPI0003796050|nr:cytochrome c oxidase assembly protein [Halomonas lutea]
MRGDLGKPLFIALWLLIPRVSTAHGGEIHGTDGLWQEWNTAASTLLPLLLGVGFYVLGVFRLWHKAGVGRGIPVFRAAVYGLGMLTLIVALVSPLDMAANALFSMHMTQHLLLILVAPPLLISGNPDVALLWALPHRWRAGWGRCEQRLARSLTGGKGALIVVLLATGVLWAWHLPQLYDLAVRNEAVHWVEHAGFLITALLFWITVLRIRPREHIDNGMRILYVFGMALQGSLLGALITFATRPLYQSHMTVPSQWGLDPLADQQVAGLIMWVPPAMLYMGVVAYLFVYWLNAAATRNEERKRQDAHRA